MSCASLTSISEGCLAIDLVMFPKYIASNCSKKCSDYEDAIKYYKAHSSAFTNKSLKTSFTVKGGVLILEVFFTSINSCHLANLINTFVLINSLDHTSHNISETFHINFMIVNGITYSKALPKRFCLESITTQLAKEDRLT